jgi:hypothetical protein
MKISTPNAAVLPYSSAISTNAQCSYELGEQFLTLIAF